MLFYSFAFCQDYVKSLAWFTQEEDVCAFVCVAYTASHHAGQPASYGIIPYFVGYSHISMPVAAPSSLDTFGLMGGKGGGERREEGE